MDLNVAGIVDADVHDTERAECTVFIIEPDRSVQGSLEQLVTASGWQSEAFASAEEFLGRPSHAAPCCAVVDVTLPGLSGLELQRRLAMRPSVPIVFVTG